MITYWITCLMSMAIAWIGMHAKHDSTKEYSYRIKIGLLSCIPLTLVAGLRYDVGQDYMYTYAPYFNRISDGRHPEELEFLYHWMNVGLAKVTSDYAWLFLITAIIFMVLVFMAIFRDSPYPTISIFLLVGMCYYFVFMNMMRQMIAIAIIMFALRFIEEKRPLAFYICVVLAVGFHTTAVVCLPLYFISKIKMKPKTVLFVSVAAAAAYYAGLSKIISTLTYRFMDVLGYGNYIGSIYDNKEGGYIVFAINIVLMIFASIFYIMPEEDGEVKTDEDKAYIEKEELKYRIYYNLQIIATWIAALSGNIVLINRIRVYFSLPSIILVALALQRIKKRELKILATVLIVAAYFVYASYTIGVNNANTVLPYQTIFNR